MMNESKPLRAPAGLSAAGRALWRQIAADWADNGVVPDAREHRLLADACREADVLALLEAEIAAAAASGGARCCSASSSRHDGCD